MTLTPCRFRGASMRFIEISWSLSNLITMYALFALVRDHSVDAA